MNLSKIKTLIPAPESTYHIELSNDNSQVNCDYSGSPIAGAVYESSVISLWYGGSDAWNEFNVTVAASGITHGYNSNTHSLNPSAITANTATITVTARHKTRADVVLQAVYTLTKNKAGSPGATPVSRSLKPSLHVIRKSSDGSFLDTQLSFEVHIRRGTELTVVSTLGELYGNALDIKIGDTYIGDGSKDNQPITVATADFWTNNDSQIVRLEHEIDTEICYDSESIGVVTDGEDGLTAASGLFIPAIIWVEADEDGWSVGNQSFNVTPSVMVDGVSSGFEDPLTIISTPTSVTAAYKSNLGIITISIADYTDPVDYEGEVKVRMEAIVNGKTYSVTKGIPILAKKKGEQGEPGENALTYDIEPSEALIHANKDGDILTGAITIKAYRKEGKNARTQLAIGGSIKTDDYYHWIQYKIDNGSWQFCSHSGSNATVPSATVATISNGIAFRLVRGASSTSYTVMKEYPTIPVVWDGLTGGRGKTGPLWYLAGPWNSAIAYERTDELVPVVEYNGYYWYIAKENYIAEGEEPTASSETWHLADDFQMIFTEALFANFARLGSAIVSGDFLFSMNGYISGVEYGNGKKLYTSSADHAPDATEEDIAVAAYTRFCGDDLKGGLEAFDVESSTRQVLFTVRLQRGVRLLVNFRYKGYGYIYVRRKGETAMLAYSYTLMGTTSYDRSLNYLSTENADYEVVSYSVPDGDNERTLSFFYLEYSLSGMFEPNWWVNLRTGKMSAASGQFLVDGDGNVNIKGALTYNKTAHARFRLVETDTTVYPNKHTYMAEPYPYTGEGLTAMMTCNIFQLRGTVSYATQDVYKVALPPARFFEGMELTIINACYDQSGSGASYVFNYGVQFTLFVPGEFSTSGADPDIDNSNAGQYYNRFGFLINAQGKIWSSDGWEKTLTVPASVRRLTLIAGKHPCLEWQSNQLRTAQKEKCIAWLVSGFQE